MHFNAICERDLKTQSCLIKVEYWFSLSSQSVSLTTHNCVHICLSVSSLFFGIILCLAVSLPVCVTCFCVCLSMHLSLCVILSDCLSTDFAGGQTGRQARLAWL